MIKRCLCCDNQVQEEFYEADTYTLCTVCGDISVEYLQEEGEIEEVVFVD